MVFCFVQKCFFGQHESQNIFFSPEFNIRLYVKNSESDYLFFFSSKIRIFFSATLRIRIFVYKKTITPPFKLNGLLKNFIIQKWFGLREPQSKPFLNNKINFFCDEYHADIFSMHKFSPLKQKKYNFVVLIQIFSCFISTQYYINI